ncbi:hypothetical protein OG864_45165 [Streptomyces sp. NBC_00124]|uniref:hypothetical protein n=1 Tax=Streptomyces sp. NBC_00124 TaxID=2975662 RepID=UPI002252E8D0|nr:hypothetical protein [Streptomyces sp. NBC_00124]MCX5365893.1 hypothetical protein [Streptomyces sp. NBC_00124]
MTTPADCDPTWSDAPLDHTPTAFTLRQDEMRDLRAQGAGARELWTAHTVPMTEEYL